MVTAALTADLSLILLDATKGIREQTRRHAYVSFMLGIPKVIVCINKMDMVGYSQEVFESLSNLFCDFAGSLGFQSVDFVPISALRGDNIVDSGGAMQWYQGPTLLQYLETVEITHKQGGASRFPVQYVIRADGSNQDGRPFRGYAGQICGGAFAVGDRVVVLPSHRISRVRDIQVDSHSLESASFPLSVTILLEDELDISRGDVLVHPGFEPNVSNELTATVCWMDEEPLRKDRHYYIKHCSKTARAKIVDVQSKIDINTLHRSNNGVESLELNEIGTVLLALAQPLVFDTYEENRLTGSFIIIDEATNATAGAGLIQGSAVPVAGKFSL